MFSLIAIPMSNITELRQNFVDIQAITLKVISFRDISGNCRNLEIKIFAMRLSIIVFNFLNMSKNKYNCFFCGYTFISLPWFWRSFRSKSDIHRRYITI